MNNIWILHFKVEKPKSGYSFGPMFNKMLWPIENGWGLGSTGAYNFFIRYGFSPKFLINEFPNKIHNQDIVIICLDGLIINKKFKDQIRSISEDKFVLICSGSISGWKDIFPEIFTGEEKSFKNIYSAIGFNNIFKNLSLMSPNKWNYYDHLSTGNCGMHFHGNIVSIHGERQSKVRSNKSHFKSAPALICWNRTSFINASPFHAFQSWLQGQERLSTWWDWRRRFFWLDDYCVDLKFILENYTSVKLKFNSQDAINTENYNTVIIKHDLDYSKDPAYFNIEVKNQIPSTYALLDDKNFRYWIKKLSNNESIELAFHYNTSKYYKFLNYFLKKIGINKFSMYKVDRSLIANSGLINQIYSIQKKGLRPKTLHRHLQYIYYPEYIESLRKAMSKFNYLLGACSYFRGVIIRWGSPDINGNNAEAAEFPDCQFPYWHPFKLAHAGLYGVMIDGWECTSLMEVEFEFIEKLLNTVDYEIPGRVYVINFHPAHTNKAIFNESSGLINFEKIVKYLTDNKIKIIKLDKLFKNLNEKLI
jgi:hypothetical protein